MTFTMVANWVRIILILQITKIDEKVFPAMDLLSAGDAVRVNQAILGLLESIGVEIIDIPENIPPELLYNILISNWDQPVQYLPSSGYDLELCTGDPQSCPYGGFCDCITREELEDEEGSDDANPENDEYFRLPF
jgi:hypothetical protein